MASFAEEVKNRLRKDLVEDGRFVQGGREVLKLHEIGLLSVQAPDTGGRSIVGSVTVTGASFAEQNLTGRDVAPLIILVSLGVDFVYEKQAYHQLDTKEMVFDYFTDEWHGWTGPLGRYNVMAATLASYAQGMQEETDLALESYALNLQYHKISG